MVMVRIKIYKSDKKIQSYINKCQAFTIRDNPKIARRITATAARVAVAATEANHTTRELVLGKGNLLHTTIITANLHTTSKNIISNSH
jgi:hypothetical protein